MEKETSAKEIAALVRKELRMAMEYYAIGDRNRAYAAAERAQHAAFDLKDLFRPDVPA